MSLPPLPTPQQVASQIARWGREEPDFARRLVPGDVGAALHGFGAHCRQGQRLDNAIAAFGMALTLAPENARLWRELATTHQMAGDLAVADACARQSLALDPAHAATWLQHASLADRLGDAAASEGAYRRALALDPALGDAQFGLGVLYLRTRRFADAAQCLHLALESGGADALGYLCLAQALYHCGRFGESAAAFAAADAFGPLDGEHRRLHARARTFAAMIDGDVAGALAAYPALAGAWAESTEAILQAAFAQFSGFGHRDAALAVGARLAALRPDDPVHRYLLDAVEGAAHERAPRAYIARHFDDFAEGFERQLVGALNYRVPDELADLVASVRAAFGPTLDLGCGTGLAASRLRAFSDDLTGVDLSPKMLAAAARTGHYLALVEADAVDYLREASRAFDLVFAADLLIYLGRLDALFAALAAAMPPGALVAASIERMPDGDFTLLPSGRFGHSEAYVEAQARAAFDVVHRTQTSLRLEAGHPVAGTLYVLRRRDGAGSGTMMVPGH